MLIRLLQNAVAVANCLLGLVLVAVYGPALLHIHILSMTLAQEVLLLVAGSVFPLAIVTFRYPLFGGMAQFALAYIGNQLLHEAPLRTLRDFSVASMIVALTIIFSAVLRGILEITQEAFGEAQDSDDRSAGQAAA
jgi:hypothetical protein